jgi:predicted nucleic acid-binding protein
MTPCFADSFYFFALLNRHDEAHAAAVAYNARLRRPLVTTAFVLIEVADGLADTTGRELFTALRKKLSTDRRATIVPPELDLFERGAALYESRLDKAWSLTDCTSFVVMRDRGITDALTADHHFEQAGFSALLKTAVS